jgi:hypothetical protein
MVAHADGRSNQQAADLLCHFTGLQSYSYTVDGRVVGVAAAKRRWASDSH